MKKNEQESKEMAQQMEVAGMQLAKDHFKITKADMKYFLFHKGEIYMLAFGSGEKTTDNPKGKYAFWVYQKDTIPYGMLLNCELKTKYDSIDYFVSLRDNAEMSINNILNEKDKNTAIVSPFQRFEGGDDKQTR